MTIRPKPFRVGAKYHNKRTNGYASKRESQYADLLTMQKATGVIAEWETQQPIHLPGGIRYIVDFVVYMPDGTVKFVEVKGVATAAWKIKMRLLQEAKPWIYERLEVVK